MTAANLPWGVGERLGGMATGGSRAVSWRLSSRGWYRLAFFNIAMVLLFIAVLLPLAVGSVFDDLVEPPEGSIYPLMPPPGVPPAANTTRLHVSVIGLDELQLRATLRVSGDHLCPNDCSSGTRVVFFSLGTDEAATAGMPPSAKIDLSQSDFVITDTIQLPVRGHPNRYPFDTYDMVLGVALGRLQQDGTVQPQTREQGSGRLVLTVQEQLPRETMDAPTPQDAVAADQEEGTSSPYQFQTLQLLHFSRPLHIRVLAVLLVLLIAAAAAYAVFMRPLTELVVNSGGLVLGVWGIRSILMPNNPPYLTTVDRKSVV